MAVSSTVLACASQQSFDFPALPGLKAGAQRSGGGLWGTGAPDGGVLRWKAWKNRRTIGADDWSRELEREG
jgi:hypothetical protein